MSKIYYFEQNWGDEPDCVVQIVDANGNNVGEPMPVLAWIRKQVFQKTGAAWEVMREKCKEPIT